MNPYLRHLKTRASSSSCFTAVLKVAVIITLLYAFSPITVILFNGRDEQFYEWYRTSEADDPRLVEAIAKNFLLPPAPPDSKLNLSNPIWDSPVTNIVMALFEKKRNGFFIEAGAFNGEWISNSIELEDHLGWSGLLVEADPEYQKQVLTKNRKAWFAPVCLSPEARPITITMLRHKEWPALSKISTNIEKDSENGSFPFQFTVSCFPLYSILLALKRKEVDYFSLDVEKAEWAIIQHIPFEKLSIKVMSVEMSQGFPKNREYLESKGYVMTHSVRRPFVLDGIFVHKSVLPQTYLANYTSFPIKIHS